MKTKSLVKLCLISAIGSLLITKSALAIDDLDWTGFHLAGGIGYGMLSQNSYATVSSVPVTATETSGGKGWLARVGLGYNYELSSCFVIGAFADYDFTNLIGRQNFPGLVGHEKQKNAWYLGGLVGYPFTPFTLAFIDAGYTGAHFDKINYFVAISGGSPTGLTLASHTYNGWFFGLGMETLLAVRQCSSLFLRTEYRYSHFGTANIPLNGSADGVTASGIGERSRVSGQNVTVSINWAFLKPT